MREMSTKQSRHSLKLPQTSLAFYIKLYCDRKGSTKSRYQNNLIEATKSYLSLTESEKQKFSKKFEECKEKNKARFFEQLKSAKPYMKIKNVSLTNVDNTTTNALENSEHEQELPECSLERSSAASPPCETSNDNNIDYISTNSEAQTVNELEENQNILEAHQENEQPPPQPLLIEPIPPTIKTGHQLFYMLNSTEDSSNTLWTSLAPFERSRYSRAVSLLKKDYIAKYKEYLESLSSKDLFDYYYKTIA